ncbi:MAG: Mut7-C RNAse domain-containing protein [Nitrospirae bacterium]|nr:Mut7-C RNAse domain-containing protein [Nitrospirota bacterium]
MKFIADAMLGRLARWLRLLGFDTLYFPDIEDHRLLRIAREEDRTILTRDTRLVKVRGLKNFLLLHDNDPFEQLTRVLKAFSLYPPEQADSGKEGRPRLYSRCSLCNTLLEDVPKEQAKPSVPEYVYQTAGGFKQCPQCGKFYWKGTHPALLKKKLNEILSGL